MSKPNFVMLVGISGSGKSTFAKEKLNDYIIHSSDALRAELFGDENDQNHNNELFNELHKRIKNDLLKGNNVVFDATNIKRKTRIAFLKELRNINCNKKCILVIAPYFCCLNNNRKRERVVPEDVIKRMYMGFQPPHKSEGWDDIDIVFSCELNNLDYYDLGILFNPVNGIDFFNQFNRNHSLTLGKHCRKTAEYIESKCDNKLLYLTALLHDEGKIFTQTNKNSKGEYDGNCHYYQHHCVGSYNSIFYAYNEGLNIDDILHVSTLISLHMCPYIEWKNNDKLKEKYRLRLGNELFDELTILNEADRFAH